MHQKFKPRAKSQIQKPDSKVALQERKQQKERMDTEGTKSRKYHNMVSRLNYCEKMMTIFQKC